MIVCYSPSPQKVFCLLPKGWGASPSDLGDGYFNSVCYYSANLNSRGNIFKPNHVLFNINLEPDGWELNSRLSVISAAAPSNLPTSKCVLNVMRTPVNDMFTKCLETVSTFISKLGCFWWWMWLRGKSNHLPIGRLAVRVTAFVNKLNKTLFIPKGN